MTRPDAEYILRPKGESCLYKPMYSVFAIIGITKRILDESHEYAPIMGAILFGKH